MTTIKATDYPTVRVRRASRCYNDGKQTGQNRMKQNRMRFSSVNVVKVSRSSSNQEHLIHPWHRLQKRSLSLIHWKTIHHPSVHVQRINRPASSQERIITPSSRSNHMHILDESYRNLQEVKRCIR